MKAARALAALGLGLALLGAGIAAWGWSSWSRPGDTGDGAVRLVPITPGLTLSAAADTLQARGLLAHRRVFLLGARLNGQDRGLRAGLYELAPGLSPRELLAILTSGRSVQAKVTVTEGLDAEEVAAAVAAVFPFAAGAFLAAADSVVLARAAAGELAGWPAGYVDLVRAESDRRARTLHVAEGYLAPDTYVFALDSPPAAVAAHLVQTQLQRLAAVGAAGAGGRSPHEILVLASIVEAEARRADERARIAAVYVNRLARGRRLEADPTVAFVLGKKGQRLFYRDLEVDSPWNTYRVRGLPPGPIGSPGLAALAAAAAPDTGCRALYFVSDGADGHVFSETAQEHEAAVRRFRALRAEARREAAGH
ncbi:MAG TPA: endolytic transglycosylase MltG [Candidatus Krumholzibacteria bacterium]|nr:endolytic transglycosylase MltG [Candidatus Krumholzibacteria bacterium]